MKKEDKQVDLRLDLENLKAMKNHCLPPRSWFIPLSGMDEASGAGKFGKGSSRCMLLSGKWEFCYLRSFELADKAARRFRTIDVPSCWQVWGYEPPFYRNDDFTCPAIPPRVPNADPVGIYRRWKNSDGTFSESINVLYGDLGDIRVNGKSYRE